MATGDDALAAGYQVVEYTGTGFSAKVRNGGEEINRTRDYIAQLKTGLMGLLTTIPVNKGGTGATSASSARTNLGVTSGTANPSGGASGDIYFKIVG